MRHFVLLATGVAFIAASNPVSATPLSPARLMHGDDLSAIILVQEKAKKDETIKQKVKRVWRNLTGYKFAVTCPAFPIPLVAAAPPARKPARAARTHARNASRGIRSARSATQNSRS